MSKKNGTKNGSSTALVKAGEFTIIKTDAEELMELIEENLADGSIGPMSMDRIRVPAGGGSTFSVPALAEGDETKVETIDCIIVGKKKHRARWAKSIDESPGGSPPDCFSPDGKNGIGDPGGVCADCPYDEFKQVGDNEAYKKKGCKEMLFIIAVRPDERLPIAIVAPPGSLRNADDYLKRLTAKGIFYYGAVTRIGLEQDKNKLGREYSKLTFAMGQKIEGADFEAVKAFQKTFKGILEGRAFDVTDDEAALT